MKFFQNMFGSKGKVDHRDSKTTSETGGKNGCVKCGSLSYEHDAYFNEYICRACGWATKTVPKGADITTTKELQVTMSSGIMPKPEAKLETPPPQPENRLIKRCTKCNGVIPDGEDFCPVCTGGYVAEWERHVPAQGKQMVVNDLNDVLREFEDHSGTTLSEWNVKLFKELAFSGGYVVASSVMRVMCARKEGAALLFYVLNYVSPNNFARRSIEDALLGRGDAEKLLLSIEFNKLRNVISSEFGLDKGWGKWQL